MMVIQIRGLASAAMNLRTLSTAALFVFACILVAPVFAQPFLERAPVSPAALRRENSTMAALEEVAPGVFKSLSAVDDRIHLNINLFDSDYVDLLLVTPASWGEDRTLRLLNSLTAKLQWMDERRVISGVPGSIWAIARVRARIERRSWANRLWIDWEPLFQLLRAAGAGLIEVRIRLMEGSSLSVDPAMPGWTWVRVGSRPIAAWVSRPSDFAPVAAALTYGKNPKDVTAGRIGGIVILVVPIIALFLLRNRCLMRMGDPRAWRQFTQFRWFVLITSMLGWFYVLAGYSLMDQVMPLLVGHSVLLRRTVLVLTMLSMPLLHGFVAGLITIDLVKRGFGDGSRPRPMLRSMGLFLLMAGIFIGVMVAASIAPDQLNQLVNGQAGQGGIRGSVIAFVIFTGIASVVAARVMFARSVRIEPLQIADLVERVTKLGQQAGVPLRGVFLARSERQEMTNAFVTLSGAVLLTDGMILRFDRDEIDGVVAHELAHLQHRHLKKRVVVWVGGFFAGLFLTLWLRNLAPHIAGVAVAYIGIWVLPFLAGNIVSRRQELQADVGAVNLTQNPHAYLRVLSKLSKANPFVLQIKVIANTVLSHPSGLTRMEAIAKQFGLTRADIENARTVVVDTIEAGGANNRYDLPDKPESRVASLLTLAGSFKYIWPWIFAPLIIFMVPMAMGIALMSWLTPDGHGWKAVLLGLSSIALAIGSVTSSIKRISLQMWRRLRKPLQDRLEGHYKHSFGEAHYVGFAPGKDLRSYGTSTIWDIGFLEINQSLIRYSGEKSIFELSPKDVMSVRTITHKGLLAEGRTESVLIDWRRPETAVTEQFMIRVLGANTPREQSEWVRELQADLAMWQASKPQGQVNDYIYTPMRLYEPPPRIILGKQVKFSWVKLVVGAAAIGAFTVLVGWVVKKLAPQEAGSIEWLLKIIIFFFGAILLRSFVVPPSPSAAAKPEKQPESSGG